MTLDRRTRHSKKVDHTLHSWRFPLITIALLLVTTVGRANAQLDKTTILQRPVPDELEVPLVVDNALISSDTPLETEGMSVKDKIMNAWGPNEGPRAWKIVSECENGRLDPYAINWNSNGTHDVGIFMINSVHGYSDEEMFDVDKNISAAYLIYQRDGWSAWACSHVINETPFYLL